MASLAPAAIISTWEAGAGLSGWERALIAIRPILPEAGPDELAALSIGERNAHLLALRGALAGPVLHTVVTCPKCGQTLEFDQRIDELLDGYQPPAAREFTVSEGEWSARYRLLTSGDLQHAAAAGEAEGARETLIERALLETTRDGQIVDAADAPPELIRRVADDMAERDPLAQLAIPLACAACEHVWPATLDPVPIAWSELDRQAQAIFADNVQLARAYGWSEADMLALSPARRQYYLDAIE